MPNEDFLMTEAEFASFVGKSASWARLERRMGRSPVFVKVGRTPMYTRESIAEWMAANRVGPGGRPA